MAKLDDLIQQKQQRDEDWKAKKTAEREELGQLSDDAVMHVTSEPGAYLHYLDTQAINPRYSASNVIRDSVHGHGYRRGRSRGRAPRRSYCRSDGWIP